MIYKMYLIIKQLTNYLQVVCVADSGLYVRVVLSLGQTLQVSLMLRSDYHEEDCILPIQGGVFTQNLVTVLLPRKG